MPGDYQKKFSDWKKMNLQGNKGAGVKIAVLDTGNNNAPDISVNFTTDPDATDVHGHGSQTSSIIKSPIGMANDCVLYNLKCIRNDGTYTMNDIIAAVNYCISNQIDFISMSFILNDDAGMKAALVAAYDAGCQPVASTGNSSTLVPISYPACYNKVIAVNAVDEFGNAPLRNAIVSGTAEHGVNICCNGINNEVINKSGVKTISGGTSFATPWFVAAAALVKVDMGISDNHKVVRRMLNMAVKQPDTQLFGAGIFTF